MRRRAVFLLGGLIILMLPIAMCWRSPMFHDGSITKRDVHLVIDNPEVRRLLREEGANVADRQAFYSVRQKAFDSAGVEAMSEFVQHPDQHIPKHFEFLGAIARQPAEIV